MHGLAVMIALIGCALGYALVRPLAGTAGGLAAVALLGFAFSVEVAVIEATIPSIVLGLAALAAGERASIRPAWGFAAGGLVTAAIFVKLLALPFVVGLAALIVSRRLSRKALALMACGAVTVAAAVVVVHADDLMVISKQAVGLQAGRRSAPDPTSIVRTAVGGIDEIWTLPALLAITAALIALNRPSSWRRWIRDRAAMLSVLVSGLLYLSQITPLWWNYLILLSAALAVLAASSCPRRALIPSTVVAAALTGTALATPPLLAGDDLRAIRDSAAIIRASTTPDEAVVSDLPLVPLFADRKAVPTTIDSSLIRVEGGSLTEGAVLAASREASAVVLGRSYALYFQYLETTKPIEQLLQSRFPVRRVVWHGRVHITVLLRRRPASGAAR
jgi:hypothetical protein